MLDMPRLIKSWKRVSSPRAAPSIQRESFTNHHSSTRWANTAGPSSRNKEKAMDEFCLLMAHLYMYRVFLCTRIKNSYNHLRS